MNFSYRSLRDLLRDHGIPDADFDAIVLLETFAGAARSALLADPARLYTAPALTEAVEKRLARIPLQYILGTWEFMGLPFTVNGNCLIPRSDTECIAEAAIARKPARILDLCTGSGCILAAVLHFCKNAVGTAVELVPETLAVAEENFRQLGVAGRIRTICGDVREDLLPPDEEYDVITANPPYIAAAEMASLAPELSAEPRIALTDGGDGLSLYRAIFSRYRDHLAGGGVMIVEHGAAQSEAVCALAGACGMTAEPIRDYGGSLRGAVLKKNP